MIVSVSGKIGHGKDTVGKIIRYFTAIPDGTNEKCLKWLRGTMIDNSLIGLEQDISSSFIIQKFADSLKDMVCLMFNCTKEQLEQHSFKELELGEEWWYWKNLTWLTSDDEAPEIIAYSKDKVEQYSDTKRYKLVKPNIRKILQLLGTECGRNIIHPNIWVNILFANYKPVIYRSYIPQRAAGYIDTEMYPNWIITDTRFLNEIECIKKHTHVTIKVVRSTLLPSSRWIEIFPDVIIMDPDGWDRGDFGASWSQLISEEEFLRRRSLSTCITKIGAKPFEMVAHKSETELDSYKDWDYIIDNNSTLEELVDKVRQIVPQIILRKDT